MLTLTEENVPHVSVWIINSHSPLHECTLCLGLQPHALWMNIVDVQIAGTWLLQSKINTQLNNHLQTACSPIVQGLKDSKNESVIRGRLIFRASRPRVRLKEGTPPWVITSHSTIPWVS